MNIFVANAIEDEAVAQQTIRLWPNILKVIKHWQGLCKQMSQNQTLVGHRLDKAIPFKMQFIQDVASQLKGFRSCFKPKILCYSFLNILL